jgi:peptidoglycan hydrolase-like protein with peptidoglycan-binding domain
MKTRPITRAIVLGGGIALLANPVWADGGSYSHDKNQHQAVQERTEHSQDVSSFDQQQIMQLQQALQERGVEPGSIDGIMGPQTRQALAQFQRENNLQPTGALNERTAEKLGLEFSRTGHSSQSGEAMGQDKQNESNMSSREGSDHAPASSRSK